MLPYKTKKLQWHKPAVLWNKQPLRIERSLTSWWAHAL